MITRFCIWWLGDDPDLSYLRGWADGVVQYMHDPDSCVGDWPSHDQYWDLGE